MKYNWFFACWIRSQLKFIFFSFCTCHSIRSIHTHFLKLLLWNAKFVQFIEWELERTYIHKSLITFFFLFFIFFLFVLSFFVWKIHVIRNMRCSVFESCAAWGTITKLEMISALKTLTQLNSIFSSCSGLKYLALGSWSFGPDTWFLIALTKELNFFLFA